MPRKKVIDEEPEEEYEWDKTRIIIFFVVLLALIVGGFLAKHYFLDAKSTPIASQSVKGASTQNETLLPSAQSIQQGVSEQLSNLQQQASQISVQDIASSSPQVQQVIQQLQQLKSLPTSPSGVVKAACINICNGL